MATKEQPQSVAQALQTLNERLAGVRKRKTELEEKYYSAKDRYLAARADAEVKGTQAPAEPTDLRGQKDELEQLRELLPVLEERQKKQAIEAGAEKLRDINTRVTSARVKMRMLCAAAMLELVSGLDRLGKVVGDRMVESILNRANPHGFALYKAHFRGAEGMHAPQNAGLEPSLEALDFLLGKVKPDNEVDISRAEAQVTEIERVLEEGQHAGPHAL